MYIFIGCTDTIAKILCSILIKVAVHVQCQLTDKALDISM